MNVSLSRTLLHKVSKMSIWKLLTVRLGSLWRAIYSSYQQALFHFQWNSWRQAEAAKISPGFDLKRLGCSKAHNTHSCEKLLPPRLSQEYCRSSSCPRTQCSFDLFANTATFRCILILVSKFYKVFPLQQRILHAPFLIWFVCVCVCVCARAYIWRRIFQALVFIINTF